MLKSYILIALRKLAREKLYVSINIFSLALGLASFLILALYLRSELTYDQHHVNHERIYRVTAKFQQATGSGRHFAVSQIGIGPLLVKDFPQLGQQVRFRPSTQNVLQYQDNRRQWDRIYLADPTAFEIFTHKVLYGDPKTALDSPYSIAISETFARHYFGNENPIGKQLSSGAFSYAVTLVFADLPENTHLKYDALLPISLMDVFQPGFSNMYANTLGNVQLYTYLMTPPDFDPKSFGSIGVSFVDRYMKDLQARMKSTFTPILQPLTDAHFDSTLDSDLLTGNIFYVYGFLAVAIFILLVACINYMNLATARATKRAKEVGMRKVLGASKSQLIGQFLGESLTFTAIALLLALILVEVALALTPIGALMGHEHLLAARSEPIVLLSVVLLGLIVALLSGLYPAFYLSGISPLAALTQVKRSWRTGLSMRQVLVVLQLTISVGVIACTMLMTDQMRYIKDRSLGFDTENRLIVTLRGYDVVKNLKTIKNEVLKEPGVLNAMTIGQVPGTGSGAINTPVENSASVMEPIGMFIIGVGKNFIDGLNVKVLEGRAFSEDIATDAREAVMVNESMVKRLGWDNAIGKRFQVGPAGFARVIGVVEDFHYTSLHNEIGPLLITPINDQFGMVPENQKALITSSIIVVLSGQDLRATVARVKSVIAKFDPKYDAEPIFLDDRLNELYKSETNLMKLTGIFAGICIFISIMGLFGLAAFTTEQRTKEIGIRMVLGASDSQIVIMLSKHLLPLVLIAAVPASVLSYYAIDKWLQRFAYHTDISWLTFVLATLLVTVVSLTTVVLQSLKTTQADPIKALRYE
jgi:putative ABC transport system permease protein